MIMKKKIIFFLLWVLYFNCYSQWEELNVPNTSATYFSDVYAITPDIVFVIGNNGTILKTTDGGVTWITKPSSTTLNLVKVQFPTQNVGYVVATNGKLLKTINAGDSWTTIDLGLNNIFYPTLSCVTENLIFIAGMNTDYKSILLKSGDGGNSWETINGNSPLEELYDIQFFSGELGYASDDYYSLSSNSKILKTQDGGKNWIPLENSKTPFSFINENIGFSYREGLYKTTDAGNTFLYVMPYSEEFRDIYAVNEHHVWGILAGVLNWDGSTRGIMKISSPNSETYEQTTVYENSPDIDMISMHFANETTGYIVGTNNGKATIWKNGTGINLPGSLGTVEKENTSFKIYPNPASDKINIFINNQYSKEFTLSLTDMSGKIVFNHYYKNKKEVTIDVQKFYIGNYILTIKDGNQTYSQKIIIQ